MTIHVVDGDLPKEYLAATIKASIVGVDIETSGLNRLTDRIACVQVHVPEFGTVMIRSLDAIPIRLAQLLESRRITKVFQYAQFDLAFLLRDYSFITPHKVCDTKIAADVLDPENKMFIHPIDNKGSHSLIALVWHYYQDLLDKKTAVSNWFAAELSQAQLSYAAKDVIYLPDLLRRLERAIVEKDPLLVQELVRRYDRITVTALGDIKKAA